MIEKEIPERWKKAICKALDEGRLHYRVTDAQGRSCNGGEADPLPFRKWSPVRKQKMCVSGWHLTKQPHVWAGSRVWVAEGRTSRGFRQGLADKTCWSQIRVLAEVEPRRCIDPSAFVRCAPDLLVANLIGVDLRGANLRGANLEEAYLSMANLVGANLAGANLRGANLEGAYLSKANLRGASLHGANLARANLDGAYLWGANLEGANLEGACLEGANLDGAYLDGAYLDGANLWGAYLGGAYLRGANLEGANVAEEQLSKAIR